MKKSLAIGAIIIVAIVGVFYALSANHESSKGGIYSEDHCTSHAD